MTTSPFDMPKNPQWNYEDAKAWKGTVVVGESPRSTWWSAKHKGERRKCVKVISWDDVPFFIDDEDGRGSRKVFERGGGPDSSHRDIPVDDPETFEES